MTCMRSINQIGTKLGIVLAVALTVLVGVLFLPVIQTIGYTAIVQSPAVLYWLIIGAIGGGAALHKDRPNLASAIGIGALIMALLVGPYMSGVYAQEHILDNQEFEEKAELNNTSSEHVRVLPQNVANRYAESANQLPKYKTGEPDIAYHNGTYTWSYGVVPDRFFVVWQGNQWGSYYVDMERTDRSVTQEQQTVENGMGMLFLDSYAYQFNTERFDVNHKPETAFVFQNDGETYIAQSYTCHDWEWRWFPIPQPYAVPEYCGTLVIDSGGNVQDMSPSEVESSELLEGQNTYPYDLARFRMRAMTLQEGLLNRMFVGDNVPQIADTGQSDNRQPFTVPITEQDGSPALEYYIAATPSGSGDGIYQIYRIDGQTGDIQYVEFDNNLAGPQKAAGYTRSQDREPNWAANNEDGSTQITEPIPTVIDGTLYWHMRVTPTDGSQISYTTFVNAESGNVYRADTTEEIVSFIESGGSTDFEQSDSTDSGSAPNGSDGMFTVAVVEDGEVVDTFTVEDDQQVVIEAGNQSTPTEATG